MYAVYMEFDSYKQKLLNSHMHLFALSVLILNRDGQLSGFTYLLPQICPGAYFFPATFHPDH